MWEMNIVMVEDSDLANVYAKWTDPTLGVFTYSRCSKVSVVAADYFISQAIALRDAWQITTENNITKTAWVLARINTADPKVT